MYPSSRCSCTRLAGCSLPGGFCFFRAVTFPRGSQLEEGQIRAMLRVQYVTCVMCTRLASIYRLKIAIGDEAGGERWYMRRRAYGYTCWIQPAACRQKGFNSFWSRGPWQPQRVARGHTCTERDVHVGGLSYQAAELPSVHRPGTMYGVLFLPMMRIEGEREAGREGEQQRTPSSAGRSPGPAAEKHH